MNIKPIRKSWIFRRVVSCSFWAHTFNDGHDVRDIAIVKFMFNKGDLIDEVKVLFEIDSFT